MKFLVCAAKTPDTTSKIAFTDNNTKFSGDGVQFIMNPYDEWYALVRALELKESLGGTVTLLSVGTVADEQVIRKGLAIGADEAVRIDAEPSSSLFVAQQIAAYARSQQFDIIFLGKETIDYNGAEVPAMVAELLDLPFVANASKLDLNGTVATIERDIEGGEEELEVDLPFVLSAAKGMAEQRIPNMRGIMMAKTKPLQVVPAVAVAENVSVAAFELPKPKAACQIISADNIDELVNRLHTEAKVI